MIRHLYFSCFCFNGIKFSKLKCFIDIIAKFFTNIRINIVKKKYSFFRFVQVYEIRAKMQTKIAVIRGNF